MFKSSACKFSTGHKPNVLGNATDRKLRRNCGFSRLNEYSQTVQAPTYGKRKTTVLFFIGYITDAQEPRKWITDLSTAKQKPPELLNNSFVCFYLLCTWPWPRWANRKVTSPIWFNCLLLVYLFFWQKRVTLKFPTIGDTPNCSKRSHPPQHQNKRKKKSYFNIFYAKMKNYATKECFNLWLGNRQSLLLNTKANISVI